jgi:hypothetical protein
MPLNLVRRLVKGSKLTAQEHDANLDALEAAIEGRVDSDDARLQAPSAEAVTDGESESLQVWSTLLLWETIAAWWQQSSFASKLAGIANGATANSSDTFLRNRANHTGTQSAETITGLAPVATSGSYDDLDDIGVNPVIAGMIF